MHAWNRLNFIKKTYKSVWARTHFQTHSTHHRSYSVLAEEVRDRALSRTQTWLRGCFRAWLLTSLHARSKTRSWCVHHPSWGSEVNKLLDQFIYDKAQHRFSISRLIDNRWMTQSRSMHHSAQNHPFVQEAICQNRPGSYMCIKSVI